MSISESPYAYLSHAEKEAMKRYHEDNQDRQQLAVAPISGTQISMTAPIPPPPTLH
jgi:hypothetical protein